MEFPDLGKHCSLSDCKQLDFLPFQCDSCKATFCLEHRSYEAHHCSSVKAKDKHVDVCPLCQHPVSVGKGEDPNEVIGRHIDSGCKSLVKERRKQNRCCARRCRNIEPIPFNCNSCGQHYCVRHRMAADHQCDEVRLKRTAGASSAVARITRPTTIVDKKTSPSSGRPITVRG